MSIENARRWRDELERFRKIPDGWTPQVRGQKFNKLLAGIISRDGISAFYNQISIGEIDVCFRVDGFRFIMEAKWEKEPINIDPIAKLALRVSQRVESNFGVFVSMSGYTEPAKDQINQAGRPNILLIDSAMVDLLVSGVYSVSEIFNAMMDVASYEGNYFIQPNDLHKYIRRGYQVFDSAIDHSHDEEIDRMLGMLSGWDYTVVASGLPFGQVGLDYSDGRVFLSLIDGVYQLEDGTLRQVVEIENPQNRPLVSGQAVYFVRNGSVMRWQDNQYDIVLPALPGHVRLFRDNGDISVVSNGDFFSTPPIPASITRSLDVEQHPTTDVYDYPVSSAVDAASEGSNTVIVGSSGLVSYIDSTRIGIIQESNGSAVSFFDRRVFFLERGHILKSCTTDCLEVEEHVNLPFVGSVGDFVMVNNDHFYFHGGYSYGGMSYSAIIELQAS